MLTSNPGLPVPKGLDLPFVLLDQLAIIAFPFEHDQGIVLKGFDSLLAATMKWDTASGVVLQWHFIQNDHDRIDLLEYVWDSQYHIWDMGEKNVPLDETANLAHTFIGCETCTSFVSK